MPELLSFETEEVEKSWTLTDALELIRSIQPATRQFGYHLALGGGVLNRGTSDKDLDLYFLPIDTYVSDPLAMQGYLTRRFGVDSEPIGGPGYPPNVHYRLRNTFYVGHQRIDVFIV